MALIINIQKKRVCRIHKNFTSMTTSKRHLTFLLRRFNHDPQYLEIFIESQPESLLLLLLLLVFLIHLLYLIQRKRFYIPNGGPSKVVWRK